MFAYDWHYVIKYIFLVAECLRCEYQIRNFNKKSFFVRLYFFLIRALLFFFPSIFPFVLSPFSKFMLHFFYSFFWIFPAAMFAVVACWTVRLFVIYCVKWIEKLEHLNKNSNGWLDSSSFLLSVSIARGSSVQPGSKSFYGWWCMPPFDGHWWRHTWSDGSCIGLMVNITRKRYQNPPKNLLAKQIEILFITFHLESCNKFSITSLPRMLGCGTFPENIVQHEKLTVMQKVWSEHFYWKKL